MGKIKICGMLLVIAVSAMVIPACGGVAAITSTITQPVITVPPDSVDIVYTHNTSR